MEPKFIDTTTALKKFLTDLGDVDGKPPRLYVDLEGNNLSRNGTLSLITILLEPERDVYLIDVSTLKQEAFTTADPDNRTLKSILESPDIIKVFFDIRNDSSALFGLYGVGVAGIEDLQLMELASRSFYKQCVNGLAKCIERDGSIAALERIKWQTIKDKGRQLFDPSRGGSYAVFDQRPLSEDMKRYCVQNVTFMPHLREVYRRKLCDAWWRKMEAETTARIKLSQSPSFNGKGPHMALGPSEWLSWNPSVSEKGCRTLLQEAPKVKSTLSAMPSGSQEVDELAKVLAQVSVTQTDHFDDYDNDDDDDSD